MHYISFIIRLMNILFASGVRLYIGMFTLDFSCLPCKTLQVVKMSKKKNNHNYIKIKYLVNKGRSEQNQ